MELERAVARMRRAIKKSMSAGDRNMNQERMNRIPHVRRQIKRVATGILALVFYVASGVQAEPYLAIQEGYKCSKCHVNMTGGGKRTDFGNIYAQTRLANKFIDWRQMLLASADGEDDENPYKEDSASSFFTGRLNDYIAIGGDFRFRYERSEIPTNPSQDVFKQRKQSLYLEIDLVPEHIIFYQTLTGGGDAREIFGLFRWKSFYLKGGEFFLPYGLRLLDDSAVTRAVTGFTYGITDAGVELGYEPGNWAMHLAATNGTGASLENNRTKRLTGSLAYVRKRFRLGGSYSANKDAQGVETIIYGIHGGTQIGRVGILAAADIIDDSIDQQFVSIVELNLLMSRGNNLKFSYEYHDPSELIAQNVRERYSLVWEPFLFQLAQFRAGVRENRGIPQSNVQNETEYFLELHLFL